MKRPDKATHDQRAESQWVNRNSQKCASVSSKCEDILTCVVQCINFLLQLGRNFGGSFIKAKTRRYGFMNEK